MTKKMKLIRANRPDPIYRKQREGQIFDVEMDTVVRIDETRFGVPNSTPEVSHEDLKAMAVKVAPLYKFVFEIAE